jgi:hypothetical protein
MTDEAITKTSKAFLNPKNGASLTTNVSAYGATVYMNKKALKELMVALERISEAPPMECFEVHLNQEFSYFDSGDELISPHVKYESGLEEVFQTIFEQNMSEEEAKGENVYGASKPPFQVTLMHVSDKALLEEAQANNGKAVRWPGSS